MAKWIEKVLSQPTCSVPDGGKAVADLSRNASYLAAQRGDIPTIKVGGKIRVPTAWVRKQLQLDK